MMAASLATMLEISPSPQAQQITAEQVVEDCAEAMGGREKIDAVRTLLLLNTLPDHGRGQSRTEIERPNLVRLAGDVVFDGERAAFFDYPADYQGIEFVSGIETHTLGVTLPLGGAPNLFH